MAAARESQLQREAFPGMLSHELRAPVTSIYAAANMLRSGEGQLTADDRSDLIDAVVEESERLLRLLEDLLAAFQLEEGTELLREPTLLQHVIPRVVRSERQLRPDLRIELRIEPGLPVVTVCETSVEQVVRNLISNAAKYGLGEPIEVEISTDPEHDAVVTKVLDRGEGVPTQEVEALFRPFYRSTRTARAASGTGLGLYVCRGLVEAMGGRMWARPRDGGGSEFGFSVPRYDFDLDDDKKAYG